MAQEDTVATTFILSVEEAKARTELYKNLDYMRELKNKAMPHFQNGPNGPRSWNQMIDDSEALVNIFTPSRADAGKADWQSNANVGGAEVRAKMRAVAAGTGLKVPEMVFEAVNGNGIRSAKRADIFKHIVKESYSYGNPALNAFLETWHMLGQGLVVEYEGYKTGGAMQEVVESFNSLTGEVKTKKEYVKMDGRPFNILLNNQEFYWWSFFIRDVQDQPRNAWVQSYTARELEMEFSKYKNYKFLKDKEQSNKNLQQQDSAFYKKWAERMEDPDHEYEVVRMYSKEDDGSDGCLKGYEVWIDGIPMLRCPLLWGNKEKRYPFAKQVPEYFANSNFFVGVPFPIALEGYTDNKNMLLNSLVDKVARGLDPLKLVGLQNRDLLDVESEIHTADSTIYVPDIAAVKFMEHPQVNQGELALMQMLDRGIELVSIDRAQQGQTSGGGKTAREVVIADQRAQELKGNLYLSLEDLWDQKTTLRMEVVLTHYLKDKAAADSTKGQIISIKDYTFGDGTRGTLDIHVYKTKGKALSQQEIEAREQAMQEQGINYKLISMPVSYLDDWQLDFKVVPSSLRSKDKIMEEDEVMGEIQAVSTLFPEFFVANKEKYLADVLALRGHHLDEYAPPAQLPPMGPDGQPLPPEQAQGQANGQPAPTQGQPEPSLDEMLAQMSQ
jgi:hypothetical protein